MRSETRCAVFFPILIVALLVGCRTLDGPTPVEDLVHADTALDLQAYDGSMPPAAGSTSVLILGTPHLAQGDHDYSSREINRVSKALSAYNPDLLVVEHLPPDHPRGKGMDYRPALNLDSLAAAWKLSVAEADSLRRTHESRQREVARPCRLAKAYLLNYDLMNAHYHAHSHDCPALRRSNRLNSYFEWLNETEETQIGYPAAHSNGIRRLVSFDYRGADVRWFIQHKILDALKKGKVWVLWDFWPIVPRVGGTYQEERAHREDHQDCYADVLRFDNSPEWIALQYWIYEKQIRGIEWEGQALGDRQVERYWRRNRKMFGRMQDAIEARNAERVLVIVGSGHKYFLNKLTREADYRRVDPRDWLPESCSDERYEKTAE